MNKLVVLKDPKTGKITHRIVRQLPHDHQVKIGERLMGGIVQGIAPVEPVQPGQPLVQETVNALEVMEMESEMEQARRLGTLVDHP